MLYDYGFTIDFPTLNNYPIPKVTEKENKKDIRFYEKRQQAKAKKRRMKEHPMILQKEN